MQTASGDFHYTHGGLASVRLVDFVPKPGILPEERFENLGVMHQIIAEALIRSPGSLVPKEIRFLRMELKLTCPQLGEIVGLPASSLLKAECGEDVIGMETDIEIRKLVFTHLNIDIPSCSELCGNYHSRRPDPHIIRLEDDPILGWKLAA